MMTIKDKLNYARTQITSAIKDLTEAETIGDISSLIRACQQLDEQYEEMCDDWDIQHGDEPGTTYKTGLNIEFYIEGLDWHDVSLALRKLSKS